MKWPHNYNGWIIHVCLVCLQTFQHISSTNWSVVFFFNDTHPLYLLVNIENPIESSHHFLDLSQSWAAAAVTVTLSLFPDSAATRCFTITFLPDTHWPVPWRSRAALTLKNEAGDPKDLTHSSMSHGSPKTMSGGDVLPLRVIKNL